MHLLIDVRTSSLSDIGNISYAEYWASLWKRLSPHDEITFLAHDGDEVFWPEVVFLPRRFPIGSHRKSLAHHKNGPQRIISFSRLPSIDKRIPTVLFLDHLVPLLYPLDEKSWFQRKYDEYMTKKSLRQAKKIITADRDLANSLLENFRIKESQITILPHLLDLSLEGGESYEELLIEERKKSYFIVEGTSGDEWRPYELLSLYSRYLHEHHGILDMRILGNLGNNLGHIMSLIRSLDLIEHVKIMGVPTRKERARIYRSATSWVAVGPYSSTVYPLSLAAGTGLSLILSDIPAHQGYEAHTLHPNHIDELISSLIDAESVVLPIIQKQNNTGLMQEYKRIIIGEIS